MREFKIAKGSVTIPIEATGRVSIRASSKKDITLYGVLTSKEEVPLAFGQNITFKEALSAEIIALRLCTHGQVPMGYHFSETTFRRADPLNDDAPAALPEKEPTNLVQAVQRMMRNNAKLSRGSVLEPDLGNRFFQRYEVDEDDYRFEEDFSSNSQQNPETETVETSSDAPAEAPTSPEDSAGAAEDPKRPIAAE